MKSVTPVILLTASQVNGWLRFRPMTRTPGKPNRWRKRAAEIRALAEQMRDQLTKRALLRLAADYDQQAEAAEKRRLDVP
jgi:hypothetical protein